MKVERREGLALVAILVLAAVTRIIGLDAGLWYDEVFTLTHYVRAPVGQVLTDFSSLNNHMFYSLQAKATVSLLGESAWALRLPAMLFGLASLIVLWAIGRSVAGRVPTLFALLLLSISYHHVWFSQNARGYTGILVWTSLATLLLIEGLKRPSWRIWTGYGVCVAAGMYTHLSAGFFFASHALVFCIAWLARSAERLAPYPGLRDIRSIYGFGVGGLLTAILHLPLFAQVLAAVNKVSQSKTTSAMAEWVSPMRMLHEIVNSLSVFGALAPFALAGALLIVVVGAIALWRRAPILVAVYVISIPLALGLLVMLNFRIWPRYFFVDIGFIFLCLCTGAYALCGWAAGLLRMPKLKQFLFAGGVLASTAASLVLLARNYAHPKQDFDGALQLIATRREAGDVATSLGLAAEPVKSYFAPEWPVVRNEADLLSLEARAGHVWVITAFDDHVRPEQERALARIREHYLLVREMDGTLGGGAVRLYRSK
ncbi:MAG: glycosyltransferase family 39 protein [Sphingomonadales bacterium]|nr:glycosyltransferase family 39 protein [Sphingomonadales bacterium]MBK6491151.1 glycosyltransferase family 39 protein [Sphingomonadales bacterium]MBK8272655.1 glycosyltransferase family 39 protein [Sphingomonadales bacterium]MBK9588334.1 glycosyltransferase family 39 protein [Sphingomonadales bacterium]MBL0116294.1 glycosyltransferase family 39 protein [Sphingomonadales bacterium]